MTYDEAVEVHRQTVISGWRDIERAARAANNKVLEEHARKHAELLEDPPVKLGDMIATVTNALGIPQCGDCKKRQVAMNSVDTREGLASTIKGLIAAIFNS